MAVEVDAESLKQGLLGLLVALAEIIRDALRIEAFKRMENGSLTDDEVERLGQGLIALDEALHRLRTEQGVGETADSVRGQLDRLVDDILVRMVE